MRKLILASASILALGIGGAGVSVAHDMNHPGSSAGYNMPGSQTGAQLSQNQVRQAQQQLRDQGLYHGSIDGIVGRETKQAIEQFQKNNGLNQTATLDQQTMDKLLGSPNVGQGSSMPPSSGQSTAPMNNPPPASNMGNHNAPQH
jgi:peptidoglycan hydrolase-like protein with peptidoglycan-binding domain